MPGIHTKLERISSTKSCSGLHIHTPPPYHILPPTQAHNNKKEFKKNLSLKIQRPAWHLASGWPQFLEGSVNETLSGTFSREIVHSTPTAPRLFSLDDFYQIAWVGLTLPLCLSLESWDQPPSSARPAWSSEQSLAGQSSANWPILESCASKMMSDILPENSWNLRRSVYQQLDICSWTQCSSTHTYTDPKPSITKQAQHWWGLLGSCLSISSLLLTTIEQ